MRLSFKNRIFFTLLVALAPTAAAKEAIDASTFLVSKVHGELYAHRRFATDWETVKDGLKLDAGDLLQFSAGGSATFTAASGEDSPLTIQVSAPSPMALRLGIDMLRQVKVKELMLDSVVLDRSVEDASPALNLRHAVQEAWLRLQASVSSLRQQKILHAISDQHVATWENAVTLQKGQKALPLLFPPDKSVYNIKTLPGGLPIRWKGDDARRYLVFVWRSGGAPEAPVGEVRGSTYSYQVIASGTYFVQVRSADAVWQSQIHRVDVQTSLTVVDLASVAGVAGQANAQGGTAVIKLLTPLMGAEFRHVDPADIGRGSQVTFSWEVSGSAGAQSDVLSVKKDWDAAPQTRRVVGRVARLLLKPGRYRWSVSQTLKLPGGAFGEAHSETRVLTVADGDGFASVLDAVVRLPTASEKRTMYLER